MSDTLLLVPPFLVILLVKGNIGG